MGKGLFSHMEVNDLLEYGAVISGSRVREVIEIKLPERGTRSEFSQLALTELAAVDYVRNILLGQGKYFSSMKGDYRVLLPSENARQITLYMSSADKKLKRALKLSRNTPPVDTDPTGAANQTEARIMMKRSNIKRASEHANSLK